MTQPPRRCPSCLHKSSLKLLIAAIIFSATQPLFTRTAARPFLHGDAAAGKEDLSQTQAQHAAHSIHYRDLQSTVRYSVQPRAELEQARTYVDSLLADPAAARVKLAGNFTKRSKVLVAYMCFERKEMVHQALPAVLRSEGLQDFDLLISQDGGAPSVLEDGVNTVGFFIPDDQPYMYIHHPANLCTGLHNYLVKTFAFDIMGYDTLLIVEEDNVVHPQALQLLARMAELSVNEPSIGVVSVLDMDMSPLLDARRFSVGIIPTEAVVGHLWVYGLHRSKYEPVRRLMRSYYDVIKGKDYRTKHMPPLQDAIVALQRLEGFPMEGVLSQDRWFLDSLTKAGFTRRYQTLFRFFEPIGNYGLHFELNVTSFFGLYGRHMFNGRINASQAFDVTKDPADLAAINATIAERLGRLHDRFKADGEVLPADCVQATYTGLLQGRLNGLEVISHMRATGRC